MKKSSLRSKEYGLNKTTAIGAAAKEMGNSGLNSTNGDLLAGDGGNRGYFRLVVSLSWQPCHSVLGPAPYPQISA